MLMLVQEIGRLFKEKEAGWRHRNAIRTRNWALVEVDGPFVGQHSPRSRV
jgi:hypothetical protein